MHIITKVQTLEASKFKEFTKSLHAGLVLSTCKTDIVFRVWLLHKKCNNPRGDALPQIFPTRPQDSMQVFLISGWSVLAASAMQRTELREAEQVLCHILTSLFGAPRRLSSTGLWEVTLTSKGSQRREIIQLDRGEKWSQRMFLIYVDQL